MAKARKTSEGTWRIQIMVSGQRVGDTFLTKREADDWAAKKRTEILAMSSGQGGTIKTLAQALDEYAERVSPTKRGERWEIVRLNAFKKQNLPVSRKLSEVTTADLVRWRDSRLAINARGSVLRDMTLLGHVFEIARREWQWISSNPMRDVKRPQNPDHRKRVILPHEIRAMLRSLGFTREVRSVSNAVAHCFLLALSTGMRAGELCAIKWADVKPDHVVLHTSKTGKGREVPLTAVGLKIVSRMRGWDDVSVFGLKSQTLDTLFRRARDRAGLDGFTFHDSRRTAATRISRKVDALMLCRIMGWSRTDQALTYYAPKTSDIAALLA